MLFRKGKDLIHDHLHIGRNNVIARALGQMPDIICCGHDEVKNIEGFKFDLISISAFDPVKKTKLVEDPSNFIEMVSFLPKTAKIVYYSTARVFDNVSKNLHSNYIKNKLLEENVLFSLFKDVSIFYLPNLIPECSEDNSPFFSMVKKNYKDNFVSFDVTPESTWNYIYPSDIPQSLTDLERVLTKQILLSKTSISVAQIVDKLIGRRNLNVFYNGDKTEDYPNRDLCSCIYTSNDAGQNLSWVENLMEHWEHED